MLLFELVLYLIVFFVYLLGVYNDVIIEVVKVVGFINV